MSERIQYEIDGQSFDAVVARPGGTGPKPAVLVCHAWGGRSGFEEDKARALADLGYIGVAIDLYGVGRRGTHREQSQALMGELTGSPELLHARLRRAVEEAKRIEGVDTERVAVTGYCFGGLCAILCARLNLPVRSIVSFHGLLKIGGNLPAPIQPRILVLHGQDDPMAPPEDVGRFAEEMKRIDADWQLHAYPGVMHAFTNPKAKDPDFGTVYDAEADRRSWLAMRGFLAETLG